ncbi:hypothetical protein JCM33374_g5457 [Metschnikowia sp. JCM 33374]|nr:hypothetical protein JCM33374_g5457 [Metschnikowia sp. JCM 33374]
MGEECPVPCSPQLQESSDALTSETEALDTEETSPSTSPNWTAETVKVPLSHEERENLSFEVRKAIANLDKFKYKTLASKHGNLVAPKTRPSCKICEHKLTSSCKNCEHNPTSKTDISQEKVKVGKDGKTKRPKRKKKHYDYSTVNVKHTVVHVPQLQNKAKNTNIKDGSNEHRIKGHTYEPELPIKRTRYHRGNLDVLANLHPNMTYHKNSSFDIDKPYQQEFTRVEVDPSTGDTKNVTRSALCPYCEDVTFHVIKNSAYALHMSQVHGIYPHGYLAPNPLWHGEYKVINKVNAAKKKSTKNNEAVVCPACYEVVGISGSYFKSKRKLPQSKKRPHLKYLRHFQAKHRVESKRENYFDSSE